MYPCGTLYPSPTPPGANRVKITTPAGMKNWNYFDGLDSIADIQDFEYILRKHGEKTDNPLVKINLNKIESRITMKQ